jgi:hypothetical protein
VAIALERESQGPSGALEFLKAHVAEFGLSPHEVLSRATVVPGHAAGTDIRRRRRNIKKIMAPTGTDTETIQGPYSCAAADALNS